MSEVAVQHSGDSALLSLHCSLENAFTNKDYVLVMIGAVCSAVFKKANNYWLFDSHSYSNSGLSCCDGKSVLISFACLNNLLTFLYACMIAWKFWYLQNGLPFWMNRNCYDFSVKLKGIPANAFFSFCSDCSDFVNDLKITVFLAWFVNNCSRWRILYRLINSWLWLVEEKKKVLSPDSARTGAKSLESWGHLQSQA